MRHVWLVIVVCACGPKHGGGSASDQPESVFEPVLAPKGWSSGGGSGSVSGTGTATGAAGMCPAAGVTWGSDRVKVTMDGDVLFDFDKTDVKPVAEALLAEVKATLIDPHPNARIVVEGHTDDVGKDGYNDDLSKRRAASVASYLGGLGVAADRITPRGYGEMHPRVENTDKKSRALNRRVEIVVIDESIAAETVASGGEGCQDACCALDAPSGCVPVAASGWGEQLAAREMESTAGVLRLQTCVATRSGAIWITSTGENKIAKLDERTGEEIFRKPTWGEFPNRTSVAADGSVWITNRDSGSYIHLDPEGEPICASEYEVCMTRAAAVDADGDAWIGCFDKRLLIEVSTTETSGSVEVTDGKSTREVAGCKELRRVELGNVYPYGLVADRDGGLWVGINGPAPAVKVDSRTGEIVGSHDIASDPKLPSGCWSPYGITIDPDGNPWYANYECDNVVKLDGRTGAVLAVSTGGPEGMRAPRALGVDRRGHVWAAENDAPFVDEFGADGTWVKRVDLSGCGTGAGLLGTGSDSEGHMWTVAESGHKVAEYDVGGNFLGCYPGNPLVSPYTYSDFTGSALDLGGSDRGRVVVTLEDAAVKQWTGLGLRAAIPAGTSVCLRARAPGGAWSETWCPSAQASTMIPLAFAAAARPAGPALEVELALASSDTATTPLIYGLGAAGER